MCYSTRGLSITEGDTFALSDGVNTPTVITFSLVAAPGAVSVTNAMTADQRATALANFINAAHGAGFQITASAVGGGSGRVNLTNDNEGLAGNQVVPWLNAGTPGSAGSVSVVIGAIKVFGMAGGRVSIRVAELQGQEVPLLSDGAGALNPGDNLTVSAATGGRVKKVTAGSPQIGVCTSAAAATADASVSAVLKN